MTISSFAQGRMVSAFSQIGGDCAFRIKGSRKNKFTILGVEAPAWQGVKVLEYRDIPSFHNVARRDASAYKM